MYIANFFYIDFCLISFDFPKMTLNVDPFIHGNFTNLKRKRFKNFQEIISSIFVVKF